MSHAWRSWLLAVLVMGLGIGLYHFDNWYEAMPDSWIKNLLDDLEIAILGPGLALLVLVLTQNARLKEQAHQRRLEEERQGRFLLLGRIAASVAHEVRNPLHNLRLLDEELRAQAPPACTPLLDRVEANLRRLDHAVALAYELARPARHPDDADLDELALPPLVEATIAETTRRLGRAPGIRHHVPEEAALVAAREPALRIAVANLVRNAVEAAGSEAVEIAYRRDDGYWRLEIANPGRLPDEVLAGDGVSSSLKPDGLGVGLGIVRHLAASFSGRLELGNLPGRVQATLFIPAAPER
jgi:signal transduction histidine kinase